MIIKKNKGFTLIELLVVIAIIGILSSIVLVSLGGARQRARDARRESDIRQISLAMEMFYDGNNGRYATVTASSAVGPDGGLAPYLTPLPVSPGVGSYWWYANTGDLQTYCVFATTESNEAGTANYAIVATQKGVRSTTSAPGNLADCFNW